jgi:septum formation protein
MDAPEIILASGSPRRSELLGGMGIRFEVVTADTREFDGESSPHLSPAELATENARLKARAVAELRPGRWILGADTVVALDGRSFGKPSSPDQASKFLRVLSGRTHEVITACALISSAGETELFLELSDATIGRYVEAVNVLDKAGGYALQQHGDWIIDQVEGSRTNVVGLPTETLEQVFRNLGWLET